MGRAARGSLDQSEVRPAGFPQANPGGSPVTGSPHDPVAITLDFDHDAADGAPAARFTKLLCPMLEAGGPLGESAAPAGVPLAAAGC